MPVQQRQKVARPRQARAMMSSCCTNGTAAAVTVAAALAALVLVGDTMLLAGNVDALAEDCLEHDREAKSLTIMETVPCHYVNMRGNLPFVPSASTTYDDEIDPACFLKALLVATALLSCHYLLSCLLLLIGGILRGCHALFVPWLVAHALVIILLAGLAATEIGMSGGAVTVSYVGYGMWTAVVISVLMWVGALISWLEVKTAGEATDGPKFNYRKF